MTTNSRRARLMAGVARLGQVRIRDRVFALALVLDRLRQFEQRIADDGFDQFDDAHALPLRPLYRGAVECLLKFVDFVGGVDPTLLAPREGELGVVRLHRRRHQVAEPGRYASGVAGPSDGVCAATRTGAETAAAATTAMNLGAVMAASCL